jgi:hypothetical protein
LLWIGAQRPTVSPDATRSLPSAYPNTTSTATRRAAKKMIGMSQLILPQQPRAIASAAEFVDHLATQLFDGVEVGNELGMEWDVSR